MIDLKDVTPLHVLPEVLRKDPKIQAAGYAMGKTARMLLKKIDTVAVYAAIDILPDEIVDLLAMEFRAQYYNQNASLTEKREAIKRALPWFRKAGTASAVIELCEFMYGESKVQEWFEYNGRPYTFKAEMLAEDVPISPEDIENCIQAIKKVKNTRSLLEALVFHRRLNTQVYSGITAASYMRQPIVDFYREETENSSESLSAVRAEKAYIKQPIVDFEETELEFVQESKSGAIPMFNQTQIIMEEQ